jgi:hypothetical protein
MLLTEKRLRDPPLSELLSLYLRCLSTLASELRVSKRNAQAFNNYSQWCGLSASLRDSVLQYVRVLCDGGLPKSGILFLSHILKIPSLAPSVLMDMYGMDKMFAGLDVHISRHEMFSEDVCFLFLYFAYVILAMQAPPIVFSHVDLPAVSSSLINLFSSFSQVSPESFLKCKTVFEYAFIWSGVTGEESLQDSNIDSTMTLIQKTLVRSYIMLLSSTGFADELAALKSRSITAYLKYDKITDVMLCMRAGDTVKDGDEVISKCVIEVFSSCVQLLQSGVPGSREVVRNSLNRLISDTDTDDVVITEEMEMAFLSSHEAKDEGIQYFSILCLVLRYSVCGDYINSNRTWKEILNFHATPSLKAIPSHVRVHIFSCRDEMRTTNFRDTQILVEPPVTLGDIR